MFEMPLLLTGLLAVAAPVLIHLLHRQKTQPIAWGAMQFLRESPIMKRRRRKIDHWLLMLARIALLALLAFLLARPVIRNAAFASLSSHAPTDIGIVVDHSLASGRRAGNRTVFQREAVLVKKIIARTHAGDSISVVLAQQHPRALSHFPIAANANRSIRRRILNPLSHAHAGATAASIPAAIAKARDVMRLGHNTRKAIFVVSDQQVYNWKPRDDAAWRDALTESGGGKTKKLMRVFNVPARAGAIGTDVSVGWVHYEPHILGIHRSAIVSAAIHDSGPKRTHNIAVTLSVDGKPVSTKTLATLGPKKTHTVQFAVRFDTAGSHWLKVSTPVIDALAADNQALAAVHVWRQLPVLIIDGQLTSAGSFRRSMFLRTAMQPVSASEASTTFIQPTVVGVSDAPSQQLSRYSLVVVNDVPQLPPDFLRRLKLYANEGHGLWFILGPSTQSFFVNRRMAQAGLGIGTVKNVRHAGKSPAIVIRRKRNAMVRLLASGGRNAIVGVTLQKWWTFSKLDPRAQVIVATSSGSPLVLTRSVGPNGGRMAVWTTSVDGRWNDWPTEAGSFVPLVNETVFNLALAAQRGAIHYTLEPGQSIQWTKSAKPAVQSVLINRPDGVVAKVQPILTSAGRYLAVYSHTYTPGLYTLRQVPAPASARPVYYCVGINSRELNFDRMSRADLAYLKKQKYIRGTIRPSGVNRALGAAEHGLQLWPYLAIFMLLFLIFETFLTWRLVRGRDRESVADAGLLTGIAA